MKYPVYSKDGEHDYDVSIDVEHPDGTYYAIYYSMNSSWTNKGKTIGGILDDGNGLIFSKSLQVSKAGIDYDVATEILILLAFIKNKGHLCDSYEIREPATIIAKI